MGAPEPIDVSNVALRISGDAFALARIIEACKVAMREYEFNGKPTSELVTVFVPGPDPT